MTVNRSKVAESALWFSVAMNVVAVVADLAGRRYSAAAVQSLVLVVITAAAAIFQKLHARLDADIAGAIAQRDTAETICREIQRATQSGGLRVGVSGEVSATRTH